MAVHRRARRCLGQCLAETGWTGRFPCIPAIYLRIHRHTQRRHGDAREPAGEPASDHRVVLSVAVHCVRGVVAAASRHGADREPAAPAIPWWSFRVHVTGRLRATAYSLVARDHQVSRHARRRAQFRLRLVCFGNQRTTTCRTRPEFLGSRLHGCRTRAGPHAARIRGRFRTLSLHARCVLPVLRPGGNDVARHREQEGRIGRDGAAQCDSTAATPRGGRPAGHRQRQRNGHG